MVDISQLIDKKIDETFIIKAPKSYTSNSSVRKTTTTVPPQTRQKNLLTPKLNIKQDQSLLIRAAKTRGESHGGFRSDATTQPTKAQTDPWKAHKRLALLQHPLWIECVKSWWNVMDPHDTSSLETGTEGKVTMEQYLDLNVRLQKCLNPEFEYDNACASAAEDWQVDADDWSETVSVGETQHPVTPTSQYAESEARPSLKIFTFDKFSEFLFEIGEAWCDGSIESILVVVNSAMLQISQGVHLCSSIFKDIESIKQLPAALFAEIADMGLNNTVSGQDFIKWYQRYFLEIISMRKYVSERLFRVMPHEARINDLWIMEEGYNQTEVLIQCINRLEGLLNRIQKGNPVRLPLKDESLKPKIQPNSSITQSSTKRPKYVLPPIRPKEPINGSSQNIIVYSRNVKLSLVGQALSARRTSNESEPKNFESPKPVSRNIKLPTANLNSVVSQKLATEISAQVTDNDLRYENLFEELSDRRPYSTPLHDIKHLVFVRSHSSIDLKSKEARKLFEESLDPEYTPKLQFKKIDVKFHKIDKTWRKGKFCRAEVENNSPEVGEINKKSPLEYYETKKKHGKEMIKNFDISRKSKTQDMSVRSKPSPSKNDSDKKESVIIDEIEKLVGIKINVSTPKKESSEEKVVQTAPVPSRKLNNKVIAEYTFEDFSHLIKPRKTQKLVFKDSLEFLYALNQAKFDFNQANQSNFLTYQKKNNEYRSRRDELGGSISREEWRTFIQRLEEIIRITKARRKRRNINRKKRGKTGKKIGLARGRLWRNVFIKPVNQEHINRNNYLREAKKLDNVKNDLPEGLQAIVNDTVKDLVSQPVHINKSKKRRYSPGRYRTLPNN